MASLARALASALFPARAAARGPGARAGVLMRTVAARLFRGNPVSAPELDRRALERALARWVHERDG